MGMFRLRRSRVVPPDVSYAEEEIDLSGLEDEVAHAIATDMAEVSPIDASGAASDGVGVGEAPSRKQSVATQASLAALTAFETEMRDAAAALEALDSTVAVIAASHQSAVRLLGGLRSGVLRTSELEDSHAAALAENRRHAQQAEQAKHLLSQQESMNEANTRRIELLVKDYDEAKVALGAAQLDANDARSSLADAETEKAALIHELATKSAAIDRLSKDNELLRQKYVNQQLNHSALEQRYAEIERKVEDISATRNTEMVAMADLRARLENSEKECRRLHKQAEQAQIRLAESQQQIMTLEADLEELTERHASTTQRLQSEAGVLKARLDAASRKHVADVDEVGKLKQQLGDALASATVLEAQLASVTEQLQAERAARLANAAVSMETVEVADNLTATEEVLGSADENGAKSVKTNSAKSSVDAKNAGELSAAHVHLSRKRQGNRM